MNDDIRKLFPVTERYVYLNHSTVAPISLPVYERMLTQARDQLEHGIVNFKQWLTMVRKTREAAAGLINAKRDQIAFAQNTSAGLAIIANGIDWQAGDNIVTAECEFPANIVPWRRIQREYGVELRLAHERDGRLETEEILSLIDGRTRLVTLSFVQYASGFRADLANIGRYCRERDLLFLVDAIQGLGALRLDVEASYIDALSADAHKYLLGTEGCAIFYVSARALERVKPTLVGWLSLENPENHGDCEQPYAKSARRFEPGSLNTLGLAGLGAALELFQEVGMEKIERYLIDLGDYLSQRLTDHGYQVISSRREGEKSAIICCRHAKYSADFLANSLGERQIVTAARAGRLRISPHFYNTRNEIDRLIECLPV
ncbi:MAG: aminotransferase class V-fold PLP-dependent enzyme [Acidobacteria bacterium]|nr:aminotransferase class V-fold PLP-dependent enzyme [Acidobacteriota bacterium]